MASSKERIKERLHERMEQAASVAAEKRELEQRTLEAASSPEGVMGATLYSLFDAIDTRNRRTRSYRFLGRRAVARLKGRKIEAYRMTKEYWDGERVFMLEGNELEARNITLPGGEVELDEEHTFSHQWLLELDGPIQIKGSLQPWGDLHCFIFSMTTELNTMETERDLKHHVIASDKTGIWVAETLSFSDGKLEDPLVALGNSSYDQALSLIAQARMTLTPDLTES